MALYPLITAVTSQLSKLSRHFLTLDCTSLEGIS